MSSYQIAILFIHVSLTSFSFFIYLFNFVMPHIYIMLTVHLIFSSTILRYPCYTTLFSYLHSSSAVPVAATPSLAPRQRGPPKGYYNDNGEDDDDKEEGKRTRRKKETMLYCNIIFISHLREKKIEFLGFQFNFNFL